MTQGCLEVRSFSDGMVSIKMSIKMLRTDGSGPTLTFETDPDGADAIADDIKQKAAEARKALAAMRRQP